MFSLDFVFFSQLVPGEPLDSVVRIGLWFTFCQGTSIVHRTGDGFMPVTKTQSQGKTSFVKEFLHDHEHGNTAAVNEAWKSAGMSGSISSTLVNKTRAALGLAGN